MSAQRFTVEEIEQMANACAGDCHEFKSMSWRHDLCDTCGAGKSRHEWAGMLRAFAAQTRQVEQMIAWCDERRNAPDVTTLGQIQDKLRAMLFPKAGGQ